jgi:hypothetical protein
MMLEEEVHVNAYPADVSEHMAALHVIRIATPAIEDIVVIETADLGYRCEGFADGGLVEVGGVVVEEGVSDVFVEFC